MPLHGPADDPTQVIGADEKQLLAGQLRLRPQQRSEPVIQRLWGTDPDDADRAVVEVARDLGVDTLPFGVADPGRLGLWLPALHRDDQLLLLTVERHDSAVVAVLVALVRPRGVGRVERPEEAEAAALPLTACDAARAVRTAHALGVRLSKSRQGREDRLPIRVRVIGREQGSKLGDVINGEDYLTICRLEEEPVAANRDRLLIDVEDLTSGSKLASPGAEGSRTTCQLGTG